MARDTKRERQRKTFVANKEGLISFFWKRARNKICCGKGAFGVSYTRVEGVDCMPGGRSAFLLGGGMWMGVDGRWMLAGLWIWTGWPGLQGERDDDGDDALASGLRACCLAVLCACLPACWLAGPAFACCCSSSYCCLPGRRTRGTRNKKRQIEMSRKSKSGPSVIQGGRARGARRAERELIKIKSSSPSEDNYMVGHNDYSKKSKR